MKPLFLDFLGRRTPRTASAQPIGNLIVLGEASLCGALTGFLAIEMCPDHQGRTSRLWALYKDASQGSERLTYGRICADGPGGAPATALAFWIDPRDRLTQAAGLGCEWLIPSPTLPAHGLVQAEINTLMLPTEVMRHLGLLPEHSGTPAPSP